MLIFHHIPKTAGSTFLSILSRQYAKEEIFKIDGLNPQNSLERFKSFSLEKRNSFKLIMGHLADHFVPFLTVEHQKIIFVRDPADHFISAYHYLKRASHNPSHQKVLKMNSITEFIELRKSQNLGNLQSRHISGMTQFLLNNEPAEKVDVNQLRDQAIRVVEKTDFLFTTERFDESILTLKNELGWKKNPYYKTRNKTKNRPASEVYSDGILEQIKLLNAVDVEIYNLCRERFELKYKVLGTDEFQKSLRKFRNFNSIRSFLRT